MKRMKFFLTVAATLLAGTMMFQSCAEQDNALNPYFEELKDGQDLADAIKYHNEAGTVKLPAGVQLVMSQSIELESNLIIEGVEGAPAVITPADGASLIVDKGVTLKNVVVNAENNSQPLILLNAEPVAPALNGSNYFGIENITFQNVVLNNVKNSIIYDNNKAYCVVDLTIDNSIIKLATETVRNDALISFQGGGVKDFTIKNSTVCGNAGAKYFIRYNNSARLDRYGYDKNVEFQSMNYENNTFYNVLKTDGQWGNYSGIAGQNYSKFVIKNNIWFNSSNEVIRRLAGGRFGGNSPKEFENNTYFYNDADNSAKEASYDNGVILTSDPEFKDAENGDFAVEETSDQAINGTGDLRWGTWAAPKLAYDFAAAFAAGENPANFNGNQNNGQGFFGWENEGKTDSKRNDYKGYTWAEGSVLPEVCHVWRRSDRINNNVVEGGLNCPADREMAIDGLQEGSVVTINYEAAEGKECIWAIGDGSSEGLEGPRATATINGVEAVTGETVIPSGAKIVVSSVTPAVKGTGYIVFKVKKNTIISSIVIKNPAE